MASKRKFDQLGITFDYKSKRIKKDDTINCISIVNAEEKKANQLPKSSYLIEDSSSEPSDTSFVYQTTPDESICSVSLNEEDIEVKEPLKLEQGIKIDSNAKNSKGNDRLIEQSEKLREDLSIVYDIIDISADGNCFFRSVSYCLTSSEEGHQNIRQNVCNYINNNKLFFSEFDEGSELNYILANGRIDGVWANELLIIATALMLSVCINIFSPGYVFPLKYCEDSSWQIFLLNSNRNHFESLIAKDSSREKRSLNVDFAQSKKLNIGEVKLLKKYPMRETCYSFPANKKTCYEDYWLYLTRAIFPSRINSMPESTALEEKKKKKAQSNFTNRTKKFYILQELEEVGSISRLAFTKKKKII